MISSVLSVKCQNRQKLFPFQFNAPYHPLTSPSPEYITYKLTKPSIGGN